ncbi:cellulose synthase (UDP-forming) [Sarracenia purpurea var. burkii]
MESEVESGGMSLKNLDSQVCQVCGDNVGMTVDGEPFLACYVCAFPVCRPCYEYERNDGNQYCPQCQTKYKIHKGSTAIHGEGEEGDTDVGANKFRYSSENQNEKQKVTERMVSWHLTYDMDEVETLGFQTMIKRSHITTFLYSLMDKRFLESCLQHLLNVFLWHLLKWLGKAGTFY